MFEITPKPLEVIQAQMATFAAERVEHHKDSGHIFINLGNLALGEAGDVTRVTTSAEDHQGLDGNNKLRVPVGTEWTVATAVEYTDFLRSVGGSRYKAIQGRAEMLKGYSRFERTIATLRAELSELATRKEHPNFLGNGSNATVFSIIEGDKSYAVRVPNGKEISPGAIDSHLAGAVLGKGIPHLEQIVAASYKDGVTVAEVMPGREVGHLTVDEIKGVTDEQLVELVDTLVAVSDQGIEIDPKPSNIFYDPKEGYGIVDYHSSKVAGKESADQDLGTIVGWMATFIGSAGFYGKQPNYDKTTEEDAHDLEFIKANLDVMMRYRSIVEQKLTGETQQTALKQIDKKLQSAQESVVNYSTLIGAQGHEWKLQRHEQAKKPATDDWL
ncbi:hypothetical protein IPL85_02750 [Candidatus Saccharibacteria bacterium]|nr:MAG: hypothetical protein IPL85_02750 [Candidatus Saccharibacteria bacterium]